MVWMSRISPFFLLLKARLSQQVRPDEVVTKSTEVAGHSAQERIELGTLPLPKSPIAEA